MRTCTLEIARIGADRGDVVAPRLQTAAEMLTPARQRRLDRVAHAYDDARCGQHAPDSSDIAPIAGQLVGEVRLTCAPTRRAREVVRAEPPPVFGARLLGPLRKRRAATAPFVTEHALQIVEFAGALHVGMRGENLFDQ